MLHTNTFELKALQKTSKWSGYMYVIDGHLTVISSIDYCRVGKVECQVQADGHFIISFQSDIRSVTDRWTEMSATQA